MRLRIILIFVQFILYDQYEIAYSLIGRNVRRANANEFPYIVAIKLINDTNLEAERDFLCTGTIVSRRHVLSVEFTFQQFQINQLEIVVGSNDIRLGRRYPLQKMITFERWAERKGIPIERDVNDISLLLVAVKLPSRTRIGVISPMTPENLYGYEVETAGWGKTTSNAFPRYLETAKLTLLSKQDCQNRIQSLTYQSTNLHNFYMCTIADPYVFVRDGDSGSPLLFFGEIVGINKASTPFSEHDFHPEKVNMHTVIDYYKYFISDVLYKRF